MKERERKNVNFWSKTDQIKDLKKLKNGQKSKKKMTQQ